MAYVTGPWKLRNGTPFDELNPELCQVIDAPSWDGFCWIVTRMAYSTDNDKEGTANAFLIAASPDLLKALELHVAYEAVPTDRGGSQGPKGKAWAAFVEARDAAIKKAKGL